MSIQLDLPEGYRHTTAHLLWVSEDGETVDAVGLNFGLETGRPAQMFPVKGDQKKAEAVIASKVVPLLKEVYGLNGERVEAASVVAEVPTEIVEAKKVAARLKTAKAEILR